LLIIDGSVEAHHHGTPRRGGGGAGGIVVGRRGGGGILDGRRGGYQCQVITFDLIMDEFALIDTAAGGEEVAIA